MAMTVVEDVVSNLINEILLTKDIERIRKINEAIKHVREMQNGNKSSLDVTIDIQNPIDKAGLDRKLPSS